MKKLSVILVSSFIFSIFAIPVLAQNRDLLSPEETLWLKSRNNTIVVYPEENAPPYSYKNSAGNPQGLAVDYLELIAEKIGAKMEYLTPRSRSQIQEDVQKGKGDVIAYVTADAEKEGYLIFTGNYLTSPAVIVVRKDAPKKSGLNLNDFNGKRVAVTNGSALEGFIRINYPRVVVDEVTDDEIGLQQVVLGEVDATAMDVASLSFFLSKQVLTSVTVAGNTGFDYKPSFGVSKSSPLLQSILEKGLSQISQNDRSVLSDKWIVLPGEVQKEESDFMTIVKSNLGVASIYILFGVGIITILIYLFTRRTHRERFFRKMHDVDELKQEFSELEGESSILTRELQEIKLEEEKLKGRIDSLNK
ncbi:MAG: transporter substrate-binding domain-containing protein [Candidatus Paceibacterota bacterium]